MKLLRFTILVFCGLLPQVFVGQNVQVVVGNSVEYGRRQPILAPVMGAPATPLAGFASPASVAGVSSQGRAGASSYVESPDGVVTAIYPVTPVYQNATVSSAPESAAVKSLQGETQEGNRRADLGPSFIVDAQSPQKSISLGEVAASYKAMGGSKNVRIYANTD